MTAPAPNSPFATRLLSVLNAQPQLAVDLFLHSSELVADFDEWGPVIQANVDGEYDDESVIQRLRAVRDTIEEQLSSAG